MVFNKKSRNTLKSENGLWTVSKKYKNLRVHNHPSPILQKKKPYWLTLELARDQFVILKINKWKGKKSSTNPVIPVLTAVLFSD